MKSSKRNGHNLDFMEGDALSNKRERNTHANERMRTSFTNSGRIAGDGILYDDYSEESGYRPRFGANRTAKVTFPLDPLEQRDGPVITYKMPKEDKR